MTNEARQEVVRESAPICDVCLTALDELYRHPPNCDADCPFHDVCARCGGITNGRRVALPPSDHIRFERDARGLDVLVKP